MDIEQIRREFPILEREVNRRPLVYLDNSATSQTPRGVVDAVVGMYCSHKANVHRGVHTLSQEATVLQEEARKRIAGWINADSTEEVIFTRGATEALNLVASSFGGSRLREGDEMLLTVMEHHANIVPWQLLQSRIPFKINVVGIHPDGSLNLDELRQKLTPHTRILSVAHASNVLGTINPIREIVEMAHANGTAVVVDGAQAAPHLQPDVQALGCDFYAFSSHKMYGPAGVGVLYGRKELLEAMPPYQGGGEMIATVSLEHGTTFADLPFKFEAGTPDFVDIAAFPHALDFIESVGMDSIRCHEHSLLKYATDRLAAEFPEVEIYGAAPGKCAIISFNVHGAHHYDVGLLLDKQGIAVRTGHHCAQPLMHHLGIEGCVRTSFAAYNTPAEVDAFLHALRRAITMLA